MTDHLALETQMCFAMYNASRAITARYRDLLTPLGLTYPQYLVLLVLWRDSPLAIGELGRQLYLDTGTLSPLLKRLQTMGLVQRERSTDDERVVLVSLTDQGMAMRQNVLHIPEVICEAVGLSDSDGDALRLQVEAVAKNVRAFTEPTEH